MHSERLTAPHTVLYIDVGNRALHFLQATRTRALAASSHSRPITRRDTSLQTNHIRKRSTRRGVPASSINVAFCHTPLRTPMYIVSFESGQDDDGSLRMTQTSIFTAPHSSGSKSRCHMLTQARMRRRRMRMLRCICPTRMCKRIWCPN